MIAARELFAAKGFEAVTMRQIAERIEYTPTAIYHHFANKQALVEELCQLDFEQLRTHMHQAASIADPIERIRRVGERYLAFAMQYPNHYRFMFMTVVPPSDPESELMQERRGNPDRDAYAFLRQACVEAIAQGHLRPEFEDPDELTQICWSMLHGMISLRLVKYHSSWVPWTDIEAAAKKAIDALFRGILLTGTGT
jgi:AcrR family transcriptional regulator